MQQWKQWSLCLFLAVGMACGDEDEGANTTECAGKADGTACTGGTCQSEVCVPTTMPGGCAGKADGTACTGGICQSEICVPTTMPGGCAGKADGVPCTGGICHNNICKAPGDVPCGMWAGTYCESPLVCKGDQCQTPTQLERVVVAPSTTLSPIDSATFFVTVSGFESAAEASSVSLRMGTVPGLTFSMEVSSPVPSSRLFAVTVKYNGMTAFPSGLAAVPFELGIPHGHALDNASGNLSIPIRDGQEKTPARVIEVNEDNIQAFNAYARVLPGLQQHYKLVGNVTLPPPAAGKQSNWDAIGHWDSIDDTTFPFTGSFDGGGHTIAKLIINEPKKDFQGLFVLIGTNAVIENLGLEGVSVRGREYVGALAGQNSGLVQNSYATGKVSSTGNYVGGLVGYNYSIDSGSSVVKNSYTTCEVSGWHEVGGLVGYNYSEGSGSTSMVQDSYATGTVSGNYWVGGLVGHNRAESGGANMVQNSHATGKVSGTGNSVGGLVGENYSVASTSTVQDSYATGEVSGGGNVGGLVGENVSRGSDASSTVQNSHAIGKVRGGAVGGLVGNNCGYDFGTSVVKNSYATGEVSGAEGPISYVGGLVGHHCSAGLGSASVVQNSYATGKVSGSGEEDHMGGLVGAIHSMVSGNVMVQNSYATGEVSGTGYRVGGLVGYQHSSGASTSTVQDSYAMGEVSGDKFVGGLVGHNESYESSPSTVQNCMALNPKLSGTSAVGRVVGNNSYGGTLLNNFAFSGMRNSSNNTLWSNKGATNVDGADKDAAALKTKQGFPSQLTSPPWTYTAGRLPGLFGQTVAMPAHIQ